MKRILFTLLAVALLLGTMPAQSSAANWPVLNRGTRGADVVTLQHLLINKGYAMTADGIFGSGTETAVKDFQAKNGLTADGIVGANTWSKLVVTLQSGSSGQAVQALQKQLNAKHGYGLTVDGQFGPATDTAVRNFQSKHGLTADGIVGAATWRELVGHFQRLGTGTGFYHYNDDGNDDWGTANAIAQMKKVAVDFHATYGIRLGIGDISREHGGDFPPHSSHKNGLDVDIRPPRKDSVEGPCYYTDSSCYSRTRAQKLVDLLWATGQVERILFNDPYVTGVTYASGHDNHLHVDFKR